MKNFLLIAFICCFLNGFTTTVEVLEYGKQKIDSTTKEFELLESVIDTIQLVKVAVILARDKDKKFLLRDLYYRIKEKANALGANCFSIRTYKRDTLDRQAVLILTCYSGPDSVFRLNQRSHQKNVLYVFGLEHEEAPKANIYTNGLWYEIPGGTYIRRTVKDGEEVTLRKGMFTSEKKIIGTKNSPSVFWALHTDTDWYVHSNGMMSLPMKYTRLFQIKDTGLGHLLASLLKEVKDPKPVNPQQKQQEEN